MGMFDYVKCEYPLPDPDMQDREFQTKDLECLMEHYTITADGDLIQHYREWEETPKSERPYPNDDGLLGMFGCMRPVAGSQRDIRLVPHGFVTFYTFRDSESREWMEYQAKFTDGKLVEITRVSDTEGGA